MAHEAAKELAKEPGAEVLVLLRTGKDWCALTHPVTFHPDETYFVSSNTRAILSGGTGLTDDQLMQHWRDLYDSGSVDVHRDACVNEEGRYLVGGDAVPRTSNSAPEARAPHEAAKELAKEPGAKVFVHDGNWRALRLVAPTFCLDRTYAVTTSERTTVSGGTGISDSDLMAAAYTLGGAASMEVVNHRGVSLWRGWVETTTAEAEEARAKTFGEIECIKDAIADQMRHFDALKNIDPYADLRRILNEAFEQASQGKGARRHGSGLPFDRQPMQTISDMLGSPDFMAGQAIKKIREARGLKGGQAKRAELLGAINYVAGMILWYERQAGGGDD